MGDPVLDLVNSAQSPAAGAAARAAALLCAPVLGIVTDIRDPDQRNRVKVRIPALESGGGDSAQWARVAAPFAGDDRGAFLMPDVGDEVLLAFVHGSLDRPVVIGGLWNGSAAPPASLGNQGNRYKRIRSKNGITVTLDDQQGQETLTLETPGGQRLTLKDGPGTVTLEDANGNSITLESAGITVQAAAKVSVKAATVEVSAGMVTVDAAMAKFSGVVKCETLISTAVVSTSYTPGAGNVW